MNIDLILKALANRHRRQILDWLRSPSEHFPPPLAEHRGIPGACASYIFQKSELSQPTVTQYLQLMEQAGLVRRERHGQWTFYSRNEAGIAAAFAIVGEAMGVCEDG